MGEVEVERTALMQEETVRERERRLVALKSWRRPRPGEEVRELLKRSGWAPPDRGVTTSLLGDKIDFEDNRMLLAVILSNTTDFVSLTDTRCPRLHY